jgi:pimeloyl-ACP methyl ester carboxylesterase
MIRTTYMSLCVAFIICLPHVSGQESKTTTQTTTWSGTLDAGGTKLRLEIDIVENAGQLSGELRSLDQGNARLKTTEIEMNKELLSFSVPQVGAKFSGKLSEDGLAAEGIFAQAGAKMPLTLVKSDQIAVTAEAPLKETFKEAWVGKLKMGLIEPVMQFRIVTLESGELAARFDSITEGRTDFEATWSIDGDTIEFNVESIKLNFAGKLNEAGDLAEGIWSQGGREVPLTLQRQATVYSTENIWENRPQRPVAPFPYDSEEVTFKNTIDDVVLAGTLTLPQKSGRHPVVVLISGSGPQDRDETLMEHKPFLVLADYLTRRGIAVLRYDDRGYGESTGKFEPATTEDFARDASAAVEFLRAHDRINPAEIGLAGHSEGGLIAPMVVGLRDDIAFVVLLAATGVDGAEIVMSQTEAMLRAAKIEESEIKIVSSVNRAVVTIVVSAGPAEDISGQVSEAIEEIIQTLPAADREEGGKNLRAGIKNELKRLQGNWTRFFLRYDPRPALESINCPVLAIIGSRDTQVLPDLNMPEIKRALTAGGNQDFEIVVLEGLNHLFQKCETGAVGEYVTIQESFNPEALVKIGDWICHRTTPVK